jgi:hypothetical protein
MPPVKAEHFSSGRPRSMPMLFAAMQAVLASVSGSSDPPTAPSARSSGAGGSRFV